MVAPPARVLVTGAAGQVGRELLSSAWPAATAVIGLGREDLDITDAAAVREVLTDLKPQAVINAAAYTAVDRAESEPDLAYAINRDGPAYLAAACRDVGALLLHISTDYVFDGTQDGAYAEDDPVAPLGVYGASKEAGERAIRDAEVRHVILRTSWVYGRYGGNFVKTILRLIRERDELRIVADQHGCPTAAADIAATLAMIAGRAGQPELPLGTVHYCGAGATTWFGFATAIAAIAAPRLGRTPRVLPIATSDYPTPARRPANSVLDCTRIRRDFGVAPVPWRDSLARVLDDLLDEDGRPAPRP